MNLRALILFSFISLFTFAQREYLIHSTKSPIGTHHLFHGTFEDLPVFNTFIKKNIFEQNTRVHYSNSDLIPIERTLQSEDHILKQAKGFLKTNSTYIPVTSTTILSTDGKSFTLFISEQNETLHHINHNIHLKDTTITGSVFFPDPITSSGQLYGGDLVDNADANNSSLNNELLEVAIPGSYENGYFLLENKHLKIVNHSSPDIQPTQRVDSIFKFNRSQTGFEEVNALYHISKFADYIKDSLRFTSLMNYQIAVDVYALNGNDNSEFISSTNPPRLNFGQGGIDDAEDADILIHEYAHAVSNSAAPGTLIGYERQAMDEGYGDYWAAVYSKRINNHNYKEIFNWDGHNEFWSGRSIDNHRKYSDGLDGNKYTDGELFGSMLMTIRNNMSDSTADKLIIQSSYSWYPNMTFRDAANIILQTDTLLNQNKNSGNLLYLFCSRGFINENCENSTQDLASSLSINYDLLNQGILQIENLIQPEMAQIFSAEGKLVYKGEIFKSPISLPIISTGIYIIKVGSATFKISL